MSFPQILIAVFDSWPAILSGEHVRKFGPIIGRQIRYGLGEHVKGRRGGGAGVLGNPFGVLAGLGV